MIDYKTIRKVIKKNPPTTYYPDPDEFDNYEEYQEAYDDEKEFYMQHIATLLNYDSYEKMFEDIEGADLEEAEVELFDFFYTNMVNEDYYDYDDITNDDYDDYDDYDENY